MLKRLEGEINEVTSKLVLELKVDVEEPLEVAVSKVAWSAVMLEDVDVGETMVIAEELEL